MERVGAELVEDALGEALAEKHPADGRADLQLAADTRADLFLGLVIAIQSAAELLGNRGGEDVSEEIGQRGDVPLGADLAGTIGQVLVILPPHVE
jgi:hypothetical protein